MTKLIDEKQIEMQVKDIDRKIQEKIARGNQVQQELENINRELQRFEGEKAGLIRILSTSINADSYGK